MTAREFLPPQDATLFAAQGRDAMLQIGALVLLPGAPLRDASGALRLDDVRRHVRGRLVAMPRFRQRLVRAPIVLGPPAWVDDEAFAIEHHVRAAALPSPGDDRQLRELVARLFTAPLDVRRPLWELWLIDGVAGDRVAAVLKSSHVMADGMALLAFALAVLDGEPTAAIDEREPPRAAPPPSALELAAATVREQVRRSVAASGALTARIADPRRVVGWAGSLARAVRARSLVAPPLPITAAVANRRDVAWIGESLTDLRSVASELGATVNDVVLAVVAGALRTYLADTGAPAPRRDVRVLIPVSMHDGTDDLLVNRFAVLTAALPVDEPDPVERVRAVHAEMERHKRETDPGSSELLFRASDLLTVQLLHAVGPWVLRHQPLVNLAVSDLPGSPSPLYLLGARVLEMYPFITVTGNLALMVGALSYEDVLGIGLTVDADVVPDVDAFAAAIRDSARTLVDETRARARS